MNEHLKALSFYRRMKDALRTTGVDAVILTLYKDGEINADVRYPESSYSVENYIKWK